MNCDRIDVLDCRKHVEPELNCGFVLFKHTLYYIRLRLIPNDATEERPQP